MATATRHHEIGETFLKHAEEEFEKGDLLQASEKAWGAVAHYVKAVARERRWRENRSHVHIRQNASILIDHTNNPDNCKWMLAAVAGLHTNFYEEEFSEGDVRSGINAAKTLIDELRRAEESGKFPTERPPYRTVSSRQGTP